MAERWYARLSKVLNHELSSRQPVILYADHPDFRSTSVIPGHIGETTGGVTEGLRRRLVMPLAGPLAETDHVLGHEMVHAFQFDITSRAGPMGGMSGALRLPLAIRMASAARTFCLSSGTLGKIPFFVLVETGNSLNFKDLDLRTRGRNPWAARKAARL